jgi:hypothetical protein
MDPRRVISTLPCRGASEIRRTGGEKEECCLTQSDEPSARHASNRELQTTSTPAGEPGE